MISSRHINYILHCEKVVWIIEWLYLEKHLQLRSFLWIPTSCKLSSCVFGALVWKIWPVSDSIIFWGQSWRCLDYWRIFANSLRVELHSMFWHSIILDKFSVVSEAGKIFRHRLWQYRTFIQAYQIFNHMYQSIFTSWCIIKSTQMLVYEAGWRPRLVHRS